MRTEKPDPVEVSIIIPCYNEAETISLLLSALLRQNFPLSKMEVIIADAMSQDATRDIIGEFSREHPQLRIQVVDNPAKTIPAAVNKAAAAANGEVLVRLDAHSVPNDDYVNNTVRLLRQGVAENVGGVWDIQPGENTCIAYAIAAAASHPLGAGDALYRIASKAAYVDTVPFGGFFKNTFEKIGGFDESLLSNEDYEFNTRLRQSGGRVWLDPVIRSQYFARKTLKQLARQYWRYGYWKLRMLKRYPHSLRWRQAIPPIFVLSILILAFLSVFFAFARIILAAILGFYFLILFLFGCLEILKRKNICYIQMIAAIVVMHLSWGAGFLFSALDISREA